MNAIIPTSRCPIATRLATMDDLPFLDGLQKQHSRALGYFPTKQFEGYIEMGGVLIASLSAEYSVPSTEERVGYVISRDRYLKRDELGVIYQLCVAAGYQRGLIGATLVREVFRRSAYGCKLYCCWCAQDLPANRFWESMGFVPIAFRAGSTGKRRVHIFWQRRINDTDSGERATPYWYPCQTNSGAIREDRLVFPIPPGTHWSEVEAVAMPSPSGVGILPEPSVAEARETRSGETPKPRKKDVPPVPSKPGPLNGALFFAPPAPVKEKPPREKKPKPPRVKAKIDPQLVAKARELRDRYLERVNDHLLIAPSGKYDVSRCLAAPDAPRALPNAA